MKTIARQLGTITILVNDRQKNSCNLHKLLSNNGHIILSRLGVNVEPICASRCAALIAVVVKATVKEINGLTKSINALAGVTAKAIIITK